MASILFKLYHPYIWFKKSKCWAKWTMRKIQNGERHHIFNKTHNACKTNLQGPLAPTAQGLLKTSKQLHTHQYIQEEGQIYII